jgi:hypothetical protein
MNWRDLLPSVQERGRYTGPFSTYAEYHAVGVGFLAMLVNPDLLAPVVAYGVGHGAGKARRSGHATDAAKELGYTALGAALALGVRALGVV